MLKSSTLSIDTARKVLQKLYKQINACTVCDCSRTARKAPGVGNDQARVLLLGQNPGNPHPGAGFVPFDLTVWGTGLENQGSGAVLQSMLQVAKIPVDDIYITNVQKCGGKPDSRFVTNCADWLEEELLRLTRVQLIVPMGRFAINRMGGTIGRLEYYESRFSSTRKWLMTAVAHPAAPMRSSSISLTAYEKQWRFVGACYRQLEHV